MAFPICVDSRSKAMIFLIAAKATLMAVPTTVTESVRAQGYYPSKLLQRSCEVWVLSVPSPPKSVNKCLT